MDKSEIINKINDELNKLESIENELKTLINYYELIIDKLQKSLNTYNFI